MQRGIGKVATGSIVFLDITPEYPATGKGYTKVKASEPARTHQPSTLVVDCFITRPNAPTNPPCLYESNYYCNAGMFALNTIIYFNAPNTLRPDIT